jgi:hypothetical protein
MHPMRRSRCTLAGVVAALALLTTTACDSTAKPAASSPASSPSATASASPSKAPIAGEWGKPVTLDGYVITFTAPVDATDRFPCTGCNSATLTMNVIITAIAQPLDPSGLMVKAVDGNYSSAGVTQLGDAVIPAGKTHTAEVQIQPGIAQRKGLIVLTLTGNSGSVEWRQESRP